MGRTLYTLRDNYDSQTIVLCDEHASIMPAVDGDRVQAEPADDNCDCEPCAVEQRCRE